MQYESDGSRRITSFIASDPCDNGASHIFVGGAGSSGTNQFCSQRRSSNLPIPPVGSFPPHYLYQGKSSRGSAAPTSLGFVPSRQQSHQYRSSCSMSLPALSASGQGSGSPALTFRAVAAGLAVGAVLCFSNTYFGLQTGWVTMGSLQSAILGYGLFQGLGAMHLTQHHLSVAENVIVQTTAVATATMPLAAGLVGIVPALGLLTAEERPGGPITLDTWQLLGWCAAMAFFGVFVAVPLRYQTIVREQLRFPSGTATASVIKTLHGMEGTDNAAAGDNSRSSSRRGLRPHEGSSGIRELEDQADLEVAVTTEPGPDTAALVNSSKAQYGGGGSHLRRTLQAEQQQQQWAKALHMLLWCFAASGTYSLAAAWVSWLRVLPVFDWVGLPAATAWGWVLQPSTGYIGQGMIMGPKTALSMMAGAVTGWAVLGPAAQAKGWAPGPIKSTENGAAGWLMWVSLSLLLGDCFSELGLLLAQTAWQKARKHGLWGLQRQRAQHGLASLGRRAGYQQLRTNGERAASLAAGSMLELSPSSSLGALEDGGAAGEPQWTWGPCTSTGIGSSSSSSSTAVHPSTSAELNQGGDSNQGDRGGWMLTSKFWVPGLLLSTLMSTAILSPLMDMPVHEPLIAVLVALLVALLAVRALGQTDLNPVSGVGKISQLVFAVVSPGSVVPNLVAGAIAEAGAQQAGDLMQDFKTAHLLGVPPSSQLVAMLLGSAASVPLSVAAYLLYTNAWQVPGPILPAPMAQIWLDMAKLVNGGQLPEHVGPFCLGAAVIAVLLPLAQHLLLHLKQHQQLGRTGAEDALAAFAGNGGLSHGSAHKTSSSGSEAASDYSWPSSAAMLERVKVSLQLAVVQLLRRWRSMGAIDWALTLLPSGVGFAVGMYLSPAFTVPRLLGSLGEQLWLLLSPESHAAFMLVTASGLVLGEGCASVVTAVVKAALS